PHPHTPIFPYTTLFRSNRERQKPHLRLWEAAQDSDAIPLNGQVAHEIRFTLLGYGGPADRFLVATAKVYDLTLVTADERLMRVRSEEHTSELQSQSNLV